MVGITPIWRVQDDVGDLDDEAALVEAARVDSAAFGDLYRRYLPRIYRYLRARLGSDDEAADLTQQVFLKALEALPNYRDRGLPFAAWLFRIARNAAIDAARRRRSSIPWERVPESEHPQEPELPDTLSRSPGHGRGESCLRPVWAITRIAPTASRHLHGETV